MKKAKLGLMIFCCSLAILALAAKPVFAQQAQYPLNRYPLKQNAYLELPLGAIQPRGWLKEQLLRMAKGMTGHLDTLYPLVMGKRNGWLGGDGDVWERGPYWLDGLVPLAYILNDPALKSKAKPWIEWALTHQDTSGYFGPVPPLDEPRDEKGLQRGLARDWWPKMVMLKVLKQYYEATRDVRVLKLMTAYFKYQLTHLPVTRLDHWSFWGAQRGGDNLQVVYWLYDHTGDEFLLRLARLIHAQTTDWTGIFDKGDLLKGYFTLHGVNLAQGIKEPVVYYQQDSDIKYLDAVRKGFKDIELYHGQPQGLFGADEWLHGRSPTQGSELCTAVEMMFSLESILQITGDMRYADHLEKVAFNALPTQSDSAYMARQYYQQPNQVMISRDERNFYTSHHGTDLCYGLLTGYACCTSNMHQGWPKFTQNLWYATATGGLAAVVYAPSVVNARVNGGKAVTVTETTNYPFEEDIRFRINVKTETSFQLSLRIPSWCQNPSITINGKAIRLDAGQHVISLNRLWKDGDAIDLHLSMHMAYQTWNENALSVERGPLVYALGIKSENKRVRGTDDYGDYTEVLPLGPWNYALVKGKSFLDSAHVRVLTHTGNFNYPWSQEKPPVEIELSARRLQNWQLYLQSAGPLPYSSYEAAENTPLEIVRLIPYGCTNLRISEFPTTE